MFYQLDLSRQVLDAKGHNLWFVKENQPTLLADIRAASASSTEGAFPPRQRRIWREERDAATSLDKEHGRRERRTSRATTALNEFLDWPGVAQVGEVTCRVDEGGKHAEATRYFITSVPRAMAGASELFRWTRGHRSIENRSHDVRDVTFGEDASRIRERSGPEVMAAVRNATIGFPRSTGVTNIAGAPRRNSSRVEDLFTKLGIFKQ